MGYHNTIEQSVNAAFDLVQDLAEIGTLNQKRTTAFDFNTATAIKTSTESKKIKVIVNNVKKKTAEGFVTVKAVLIKARDVADITLYDSIVLKDGLWNFGSVLENNGFVITVAIFKES
jgi:hypothetical protein